MPVVCVCTYMHECTRATVGICTCVSTGAILCPWVQVCTHVFYAHGLCAMYVLCVCLHMPMHVSVLPGVFTYMCAHPSENPCTRV